MLGLGLRVVVLVAVADEAEGAAADAALSDGVDQGFLAAVSDPDFRRADLVHGLVQLVPVGMVGDYQGQFDAAGLGTLADPHPAGGEADDGIGEAAGPAVGDGAGRGEDDGAFEGFLLGDGGRTQVAEGDAELLVDLAEGGEGAVEVDRAIPAAAAQQGDEALTFAEGVAADDMGAVREQFDAGQQPVDFLGVGRVAEHRQGEGGFGDEDVAGDRDERVAGRVGPALVVAADDGAAAAVFHRDLGAAEDMAGRFEPHSDFAAGEDFAGVQRLLGFSPRALRPCGRASRRGLAWSRGRRGVRGGRGRRAHG